MNAADSAISAPGTPDADRRLGHVDSLRLIAAALVLVQHIAERAGGAVASALIAPGPGVAGVVLFFLVSGYVIPFSVRRGLDWRSFAVRRLLRIYPLYLATVMLVLVAGWTGLLHWWSDLPHAGPARWLANLLLVQDFVGAKPIIGVSWTLILELAWYALFAAAVLRLGNRAGNVLAVAVPMALLALGLLSLASGSRIPLGRPGLIHAAVLGYQTFRFRSGGLSPRTFWCNAAGFLVVTWLCSAVSFGAFAHSHVSLAQVIGPWTLATAVFLAVVLLPSLRSWPLLDRGLIPAVGAASYSIYLLHPIAITAALQHMDRGLFVPVALAGTALLALGGYLLVERPGIALARWLTARRPAPCTSPAGLAAEASS